MATPQSARAGIARCQCEWIVALCDNCPDSDAAAAAAADADADGGLIVKMLHLQVVERLRDVIQDAHVRHALFP